jgi:hypothetical protein
MASAPITLYGPRGEKLRTVSRVNNSLYKAATQTSDRKQVSPLDYDVHRVVTNLGRRTMMWLGRNLYSNTAIKSAVKEQAEYSSSIFLPQYFGANTDWGIAAEAWMEQHDKIVDVAGPPFNMRLYRRNLLTSIIRDGDMLTVLVKSKDGYPFIQCIPGHRIGSRLEELVVKDGEFDGARIIDGVILSDSNAAMAYRVITSDDPYDYTKYVDIPARDCFLSFIPDYVGQVRGFSILGAAAFPFQDVDESDAFELLAQKLGASISLIEKNEEGEAAPGEAADGFPITGAATGAYATEKVTAGSGVTVRYLRSGDTNAGIEALKFDRPSANQQDFRHSKLRDAFADIGWSIDFSLDPTKVGGAEMRIVVDKINRNIRALQDLVLEPACARIDGFRVSSAIQIKLLKEDPDWWKWTYQGPARLTADAKYESDVDKQEVQSGLKARRKAIANRGDYIDDVNREIEADGTIKWAMAEKLANRFKLDIVAAYNSLWNPSPNGLASWMDSNIDAPPSGDKKAAKE